MRILHLLGLTAIVALPALLGGCVTRTMLSFDDNPTQKLTTMQVMTVKKYWLWSTAEHQFFTCADNGSRLDCKRACGGNTDLICPEISETGYTSNTNIR